MKKFAIWFRKRRGTIIVFSIIIIVLIYFFGNNFVKMYRSGQQQKELEKSIAEEKTRSEQLDEELKQVGTKEYIEKIARQYFKMAYPDEKFVFTVKEEPSQQPSSEEVQQQEEPKQNEQANN